MRKKLISQTAPAPPPADDEWLDLDSLASVELTSEDPSHPIEAVVARTQEFVLRWSSDGGQSYKEIVRQQYNFSPPDTIHELEDYEVSLDGVTVLELEVDPHVGRDDVFASLNRLRLA